MYSDENSLGTNFLELSSKSIKQMLCTRGQNANLLQMYYKRKPSTSKHAHRNVFTAETDFSTEVFNNVALGKVLDGVWYCLFPAEDCPTAQLLSLRRH